MPKHIMEDNILLDAGYQQEVRNALFLLRQAFVSKIEGLKKAYRQKEITYDELVTGRKALLQELNYILTVHPKEDPADVLSKLRHYAERYSQEV